MFMRTRFSLYPRLHLRRRSRRQQGARGLERG
jgi:hypothetical protein